MKLHWLLQLIKIISIRNQSYGIAGIQQSCFDISATLVARPLTRQTMSSELRGAKNVPLQLHVHHNFLEYPGDHKSLLGQSTKTLVLIQHQQQMTLQMNICGPYWADFPISSECRGPHVKGDGD